MLRKTLTILSLIGLLLSVGAWGVSSKQALLWLGSMAAALVGFWCLVTPPGVVGLTRYTADRATDSKRMDRMEADLREIRAMMTTLLTRDS